MQLAACHLIKQRLYLCDAAVLATINFTTCSLLSMVYNRTDPATCEYTSMSISGILWQKLLMPNTWLFTTSESTLVAIICNSEREDIRIVGTEILRLDDGCIVKTPSYTIGSIYFLKLKVMETCLLEAPTLGTLPISQTIELQDPLPISNSTALTAGTIPLEPPSPLRTVVFTQMPWLFLLIIGAAIYSWRQWKKRRDARDAPEPNYPSLSDHFDAVLSSAPPSMFRRTEHVRWLIGSSNEDHRSPGAGTYF